MILAKEALSNIDPITNEITKILQLHSVIEIEAIIAHEKGDQKKAKEFDQVAAQQKHLKQEELKHFQQERKECLHLERQKQFQQKQQIKEIPQHTPATKKKKKKKKPQTKDLLNKKTEYTAPNLPISPIESTTNIKPVKTKFQQIMMVKRTLIKENNASNEANLKNMLADFCYDTKVPCMFKIFNNTVGWHYDRKTNDLSIVFNDAPIPCDYDHSLDDLSSD